MTMNALIFCSLSVVKFQRRVINLMTCQIVCSDFCAPWAALLADTPNKTDKSQKRKFERLLRAACLISDLCWKDHEDIRGEIGARRVLGLPVNCLSHKERIWLAIAIYHRYVGHKTNKSRPPELSAILGCKRRLEATTVGFGLRFALMFSGGVPNCLEYLSLTNKLGVLTLRVKEQGRSLIDKHTPPTVRTIGAERVTHS